MNSTNPYEGRRAYNRYERQIKCLAMFVKTIFPKTFCRVLWPFTNSFHGRFGALVRYCLAKALLKSCGDCVFFGPNVSIRSWEQLSIGSRCSVHANTWIDAAGEIQIGDDVAIAHNSSIITSNHGWQNTDIAIKENPVSLEPVIIENDVWIGCGVRILAGVHIAERSVIGAGAVVTKDIPAGSIAIGVPAVTRGTTF